MSRRARRKRGGRGQSAHRRDTAEMSSSRRCGARTRKGGACRGPAMTGARRCRMHGGKGSGAPLDNRNAYKHGMHTAAERARVRSLYRMIHDMEAMLARLRNIDPADSRYRNTAHGVVPRNSTPPGAPLTSRVPALQSCRSPIASPYNPCGCRIRVRSRKDRPINVSPRARGTSGGSK